MEEEIELIPVEGRVGLYRDPESTAVINVTKGVFGLYETQKNLKS